MTTVAFDGKTLAVDSRTSNSRPLPAHSLCGECNAPVKIVKITNKLRRPLKKVLFKGETVAAITGSGKRAWVNGIFRAVCGGHDLEMVADIIAGFDDNPTNIQLMGVYGTAVILTTKGTLWEAAVRTGGLKLTQVTEFPYCTGSGSLAAMAAMKFMGLNAVDALAVAIDLDQSTGGTVRYIEVGPTIKTLKPSHKDFTQKEIEALKAVQPVTKKPRKKAVTK